MPQREPSNKQSSHAMSTIEDTDKIEAISIDM